MEFEYFEYEFSEEGASRGRRIASLLAENGYQSLQKESLDLVQQYLPAAAAPATTDRLTGPRTVDVLVPPADPAARILVCERPRSGSAGGVVVAVVAVGRSQEEAHRNRTAAKIVLDTRGGEDGLSGRVVENGRARVRRFRQEWVRDLGLERREDGGEAAPTSTSPRSLAAVQPLFALQGAPPMFGRPSALRSRLDKMGEQSRLGADPGLLDGLVTEGFVERSFVLVCRDTGQIVGVGKDAAEVQAAMQLTLRCPHCRRQMSDESQDVLYSLSAQGEEFIRSTRWIREVAESSLRKRNCDAIVLADGPNRQGVDGAACYQDAVLLFRMKDGAPARDDVQAFLRAIEDFQRAVPGVPVRGAYVAAQPAPLNDAALTLDPQAPCTVLEVSHLELGLDRLLENVKRDNFVRMTGTTLELALPDPSTLLTPGPQ